MVGSVTNSPAQYCSSSSTTAFFCATSNVSIGTLNNNSFGCANYSDFTSIYTELLVNNSYSLNIGLQNCSGFSTPKVSNVYIDWDGNQNFEADENVFHINATSTLLANQINFGTTINVPSDATQDTVLMRVVTFWSVNDDLSDYSCGVYGWGETEDYSIVIRGLIDDVGVQQNLCYGDTLGQISISSTSPNALSYSIDGGLTYYSSNVFANLSNGLYNVCVYDSSTSTSQCYVNNPIVVDSPDSLFAITNVTDLSCHDSNNGQLNAQAINGTPNYTFQWTEGSNLYSGSNVTNLPQGQYSLLVTDQNGCTFSTDSIVINSPVELTIDSLVLSSYAGFNISCTNANDGSVNVLASGGNSNYSFNLNGNVTNLPLYQNLTAGPYTLTVFDSNACFKDTSFVLLEPTPISSSNTILHLGCENENDGSITTNVFGGVVPYTINITGDMSMYSNGVTNSDGNAFFDSLQVDNYAFEVTDLNDCSYVDSFNIENPQLILSVENVNCFSGTDGLINFSVDFSTDVFNVISPPSASSLSAGTYNFLIANDQGCFFDSTIVISEPDDFTLTDSVSIICDDFELADITINLFGGVLPYTILWNTGDTVLNPSYGVGLYEYQCIDNNGCVIDGTVEVLPPQIPQLSYVLTEPSCFENFDGAIDVLVEQGYPPYNYKWNNGRKESYIDSLPPNTYRLTVTDSANCQSTTLEVVLPYVYNDCFYFPSAFTPNDDGLNDVYEVVSIFKREPVVLSIFNTLGSLMHRSSELIWDGTFKGSKCPIGKYYYHLSYANQYTKGEFWLLE